MELKLLTPNYMLSGYWNYFTPLDYKVFVNKYIIRLTFMLPFIYENNISLCTLNPHSICWVFVYGLEGNSLHIYRGYLNGISHEIYSIRWFSLINNLMILFNVLQMYFIVLYRNCWFVWVMKFLLRLELISVIKCFNGEVMQIFGCTKKILFLN